jgi:hypothetical protein
MVLDSANATYGFMLRCLARCFETPWDRTDVRKQLIDGCVCAMKVLSVLGRALTRMDAASDEPSKAGVSFAMLRSMQGWLRDQDALSALAERAEEISLTICQLSIPAATRRHVEGSLSAWARDTRKLLAAQLPSRRAPG